jgi:membrane protein implicated in regulation of membrane protease activity
MFCILDINCIIDHIPLWGWIVIIGVPSIVVLYYVWPIFLPIWRALPTPIKGILIAVGAALLAYLGGRYKGRANAEEDARKRDARAQQTRDEVNREVNALPDGEARKRLRDRWTRPPP